MVFTEKAPILVTFAFYLESHYSLELMLVNPGHAMREPS